MFASVARRRVGTVTDRQDSLADLDVDETADLTPKPRVAWASGTEACASCETTFDLDTTHYYVRVESSNDEYRAAETLFCSRACVRDAIES